MAAIKISVIKHSESGKSAFCRVSTKTSLGFIECGVGYLYPEGEGEELPAVNSEAILEGFNVDFKEMVNSETGEVRATKTGVPLKKICLIPA